MFELKNKVGYSELDAQGKMSLNALINQFQNCSTFQSESLGLGLDYLKQKQRAWILTSWQIRIEQYPHLGEEIMVGTWATDFKGLYGIRNFVMKDAHDKILAWANSVWVFMDISAGRPVKPDQEEVEGYEVEPPLPFEFAPRKVKVPAKRRKEAAFPVRRYHLDTNNHVNNGQYVQMAAEYIPADRQVRQVRVSYQKSAVYQDLIVPEVHLEDDICTVMLGDGENNVYAVAEFQLERK